MEREAEELIEETKLDHAFEKLIIANEIRDIKNTLLALEAKTETLAVSFNDKLRFDEYKEKIIDRLHSEVQEYKGDLIDKATRPIMLDLIIAIDNLYKCVLNVEKKEKLEKDYVVKLLNGAKEELQEILYREGIEEYEESDIRFNPYRHKLLKVEEIDDIRKDKTISNTLSLGYEANGKVIRKQLVNVYVYKEKSEDKDIICMEGQAWIK